MTMWYPLDMALFGGYELINGTIAARRSEAIARCLNCGGSFRSHWMANGLLSREWR